MDKTYSPRDIEERIYRHWEENGLFAPGGDGPPFCIVIPPPNVTGTLHMGHAFQDTIMDARSPVHRMDGDRALWRRAGSRRHRDAEVVERHERRRADPPQRSRTASSSGRTWRRDGERSRPMRRLGASVDWSRDRFTMDPACPKQ